MLPKAKPRGSDAHAVVLEEGDVRLDPCRWVGAELISGFGIHLRSCAVLKGEQQFEYALRLWCGRIWLAAILATLLR